MVASMRVCWLPTYVTRSPASRRHTMIAQADPGQHLDWAYPHHAAADERRCQLHSHNATQRKAGPSTGSVTCHHHRTADYTTCVPSVPLPRSVSRLRLRICMHDVLVGGGND